MLQLLYGLGIFLSAFLLFLIQPLIAKVMLPLFGGSGFVWMATILFFQAVLLLGYGYAYVLAHYFSEQKQAWIHLLLIGCSLFFIPIALHDAFSQDLLPPWDVLHLLSSSVLLPCVIISASSPLLQHWYCQLKDTPFPYRFYAVSNAGSLLGLLGYPFLVEPLLGLTVQRLGWSLLYGVYLFLCVLCLSKLFNINRIEKVASVVLKPVQWNYQLKWTVLTFTSSALLLSLTQFLVQNVMNLPLLWVLPLSLYLISYIATFSKSKPYDRDYWSVSFIIWLILFLWLLYRSELGGINAVIVVHALLYSGCMVCHGELVKLKPPAQTLTLFYLYIALGGVLGGIFSNIVALLFFVNWWDLYVPLLLINGIIVVFLYKTAAIKSKLGWSYFILALSIISLMALIMVMVRNFYFPAQKLVAQFRNPYGMIKVLDAPNGDRALMHGMVVHGLQFAAPRSQLPNSYYGLTSGAGLAFEFLRNQARPLKVGIIGLGGGVLATYGRDKDIFTFYEIDKDIKTVALNYFTFIKQSKASIDIHLGDARLLLEHEVPQKFDLLVIDAFNGDAIPSHLLTKEAMKSYQQHLAKNGIIAFHTSNTYLNLLPVTKALAIEAGCQHYWIISAKNANTGLLEATWALISCDSAFDVWLQARITIHEKQFTPRLWRDDFSTILPLLKLN
ncbi:MAG: fused MFS/spermidine synthase [Proteobacteria bacterium]|nr:fused MFS/spermidine synthase [Pseudomonadota bacterium]